MLLLSLLYFKRKIRKYLKIRILQSHIIQQQYSRHHPMLTSEASPL